MASILFNDLLTVHSGDHRRGLVAPGCVTLKVVEVLERELVQVHAESNGGRNCKQKDVNSRILNNDSTEAFSIVVSGILICYQKVSIHMSDEDISENVKNGSDNILEGYNQLREGLHHLLRSLSIWVEGHPVLKWIILTPASAIIGKFGIQILTQGYVYFFGSTVPISRDVKVEVFPAPIGFTLWILLSAFVLLALLVYFRFVTLRQRIDELETQI